MKIGIALGGGGAKGLAHIGVLKVLEAHGIVPDMVSGTSIGALIGALYVLRGGIAAVEEYALGFENSNLYPHLVPRPSSSGMISEKRIRAFLQGLFGARRIEDLERPFFCPAADIRNGREVMFDRGSLRQAVRASISVPVIFKPVRLRGRYLVDGGLLNPVPVDILKKNGSDFTILGIHCLDHVTSGGTYKHQQIIDFLWGIKANAFVLLDIMHLKAKARV